MMQDTDNSMSHDRFLTVAARMRFRSRDRKGAVA